MYQFPPAAGQNESPFRPDRRKVFLDDPQAYTLWQMANPDRSKPVGDGVEDDRTAFKYRSEILVTSFILIGILLLVVGYFTDKDHPFVSFLSLQFGGLFIFGAGYSAISDYLVKKNFERLVQEKMDWVRLDQSIKTFGLGEVQQEFSFEALGARMKESSSVLMVITRSGHFFSGNYLQLVSRIEKGFSLTVVLPNPKNPALMELLYKKFTDAKTPDQLAASISTVINHWIKEKIYDALGDEARARLKVYLCDKYPLYSAYTFDRRELWYIPYQYREDFQAIPVFVFRESFERAEIYIDLEALKEKSEIHDLSGTV